jgi:predicted Rossmann fold nucleotide-binding protein DprA/Smf involved in DNA uptake
MQVSSQAQAVLLLTSHLTKSDKSEPRPLSTHEWGRFAYWLKDRGLQPASLLSEDPRRLLSGWMDRGITPDRIEYLLGRGGALGLALEKWHRAGLWVLTRSDSEYPERLKKRLQLEAPPVLFGCGNKSLLNVRGIAVVGSRNASDADLSFANQLGGDAAAQGFSIVSGGARGIDESAMFGALEREGTVVGVLADSLLRSATSAKYRKHLMSNDLVLVSPFNPEAGFNVGNAMARNCHIYCLADAAVVVTTGRDKGGTWNGAIDNLRSHCVPLWVRSHPDPDSGNPDLVRRGAKWLPNDKTDLSELLACGDGDLDVAAASRSGELPLGRRAPKASGAPHGLLHEDNATEVKEATASPEAAAKQNETKQAIPVSLNELTFYEFFLHRMTRLTAKAPLGVDDLLEHLDLSRTQLNAWLKRGVADKRLRKFTGPVRYGVKSIEPEQISMFDRA